MTGEGKYDRECTEAREATGAEGVLLIAFNGRHGSGFSAQVPPELVAVIPDTLRQVADQIEADALAQKQ